MFILENKFRKNVFNNKSLAMLFSLFFYNRSSTSQLRSHKIKNAQPGFCYSLYALHMKVKLRHLIILVRSMHCPLKYKYVNICPRLSL